MELVYLEQNNINFSVMLLHGCPTELEIRLM